MQTFLFGPYPLRLEIWDNIFFYDAAGAVILGIILVALLFLKTMNPVSRKLVRRFRNLCLTYGLIGLLWTVFRYEGAAYLEWRFWSVVLALVATIWLIKLVIYWVRDYSKEIAGFHNQQTKQKYLK